MSAFLWVDRDGKRHDLDTPAPIEAEASALAEEMDRYVLMLDHPERMIRDPARIAIRKLRPALEQVRKDLARWNGQAFASARTEAAALAAQIEQLPTMIADVVLIVALHGEHDRIVAATAGAPDIRAQVLAAPMTMLQRRAIAACAWRRWTPQRGGRRRNGSMHSRASCAAIRSMAAGSPGPTGRAMPTA